MGDLGGHSSEDVVCGRIQKVRILLGGEGKKDPLGRHRKSTRRGLVRYM